MIPLLERLGYHPRFAVWELTLACNMRCRSVPNTLYAAPEN